LVTGTSSGVGRASALALAEAGYDVFAGVRGCADGTRVEQLHPRLRHVIMDVSCEKSVDEAFRFLGDELGSRGLVGLLNNAGIALAGPIEHLPLGVWREQFDVNVLGTVAVTQRALPLLRRGNGRIVVLGSIGGRLAPPLLGPYCASKFALEGMTESLRHELRPWNIPVVLIVPGTIRTEIWRKSREQIDSVERELDADALAHYGSFLDQFRASVEKQARSGLRPEVVVRVVVNAMRAPNPRHRYVIGTEARLAELMTRVLPARWKNRLVARVAGFPSRPQTSPLIEKEN
jgi:NAD(P)-dependent dehydrogenase (short-subunit alcohol dehydrogenase family)